MGQSVCKCCNCTSSKDVKRRSNKVFPQRPLSVDCVWTQGSSLPSSIQRPHHHHSYLSDSDFQSMETSMGEDDSYTKKSQENVTTHSAEVITEIFDDPAHHVDTSDLPVFVKKLKDVTIRVGTNTRIVVELFCTSEFVVTWYRNDNQILANEDYKIINEGNLYAIEFPSVSVQDNGRWSCSAESNKGRVTSSCYLQVVVPKSYKKPVFFEELEAVLTDEGTVSLQCKVIGVPTPILRWFKDGREIKAGDIFALVANSQDPVSLGTYTCEASNCMGKVYSSSGVKVNSKVNLDTHVKEVYNIIPTGQPPIFTQELKNERVKVGESFILSCQIAVPPWPKSIKWQNAKEQYVDVTDERFHDLADGLGGYMLEVVAAVEDDKGTWKCAVISEDGCVAVSSADIQVWVPKNYRRPYFVDKLKAVLTEDGLVSFECKVVGYPTPHLRWFKDGSELKAGDIYQLTGVSSLGQYICIAKNCMGETRSEAELTVEDIKQQLSNEETMLLSAIRQPPKFVKTLVTSEAAIDTPFTFTVQVQVPPAPKLSWYRDDHAIEIDNRKYSQTTEAIGVFHLNIQRLEFEDQAEWKCVASNEFGRSECSNFLRLVIPKHYKKPKFLESLRAVLTESGIVNLECKVIGVPQPILKWYKDGVELNPGDIHKIMSGQDGTCCLGVYACEARNCMGSVISSASVHGIEDATLAKPKLRKLSLSTINEEDTFRTADDEQSLTIDQPHEISYSFDGKEISVSYYDTPDLTQEEALQIIEMYADQLSEHISEHNVLELPPLRIVKETSTASNILMEGVVIDVMPEYFSVEEDLRTEAGIEDISVIEDTLFSSRSSTRLHLDSDSHRSDYVESIQSPDLYYSVSGSKRGSKPVSRTSLDREVESFVSAKSDKISKKKTFLQDSPERPQSTAGTSRTSQEAEDLIVDDNSVLRHNSQFLTVLLSNNLTDIQQRLCYIERDLFLKSLKPRIGITETNFQNISGLIGAIQNLRTFFLSFKSKKNGDFPFTFADLDRISKDLEVNIENIHVAVVSNQNSGTQKNSIKIIYQVGETLVNVLDLIADILKLDSFELCRTNVTQSEKTRVINRLLNVRDDLNELVIITQDLFVDSSSLEDISPLQKGVIVMDSEPAEDFYSISKSEELSKDEKKLKIIEKQLIELEIGKDKQKEQVLEDIFTYQEEKINDILYDMDLVKPLFMTLSELRDSSINIAEIFENKTVQSLLFNILDVEKEIIQTEMQEIRLLELDETDYDKISKHERTKHGLKEQLEKIKEQQIVLSKMPKIPEKDLKSKEIIKQIVSLEWLEEKENGLKSYLASISQRKENLLTPPKPTKLTSKTPSQETDTRSKEILTISTELSKLRKYHSTLSDSDLNSLVLELCKKTEDTNSLTEIQTQIEELTTKFNKINFTTLTVDSYAIKRQESIERDSQKVEAEILNLRLQEFVLNQIASLRTLTHQSRDEICDAIVWELPQILEQHQQNLNVELLHSTNLTKLENHLQDVRSLKSYFKTMGNEERSRIVDEFVRNKARFTDSELQTEEFGLINEIRGVQSEKLVADFEDCHKLEIAEQTLQKKLMGVKFNKILINSEYLEAVSSIGGVINIEKILEKEKEYTLNALKTYEKCFKQKILRFNEISSLITSLSTEDILHLVDTITVENSIQQLQVDEVELCARVNEIKTEILVLESILDRTNKQDIELNEAELKTLQEQFKTIDSKLMIMELQKMVLLNRNVLTQAGSFVTEVQKVCQQQEMSLKSKLDKVQKLILRNVPKIPLKLKEISKSFEEIDLANDEKLVIVRKLKEHFAEMSEDEKVEFMREIAQNYNNDGYLEDLDETAERLTNEMHEKIELTDIMPIETKLLNTKLKQLAIARIEELTEQTETDVSDIIENTLLIIIPNLLYDQEMYLQGCIDDTLSQVSLIDGNKTVNGILFSRAKDSSLITSVLSSSQIKKLTKTLSEEDRNNLLEEIFTNYGNRYYLNTILEEEIHFVTQLQKNENPEFSQIALLKSKIKAVTLAKLSEIPNVSSDSIEAVFEEVVENLPEIIQKRDSINEILEEYSPFNYTNEVITIDKVEQYFSGAKPEKQDELTATIIQKVGDSGYTETLQNAKTTLIRKLQELSMQRDRQSRENLEEICQLEAEIESQILDIEVEQIVLETLSTAKEDAIPEILGIIQEKKASLKAKNKLLMAQEIQTYVEGLNELERTELIKDLVSNYTDPEFRDKLTGEERKLVGEINDIKALQVPTLTETAAEAQELDQILQQTEKALESKLLETKVKKLALLKVLETEQSKPIEELFQEVVLSIPEILEHQDKPQPTLAISVKAFGPTPMEQLTKITEIKQLLKTKPNLVDIQTNTPELLQVEPQILDSLEVNAITELLEPKRVVTTEVVTELLEEIKSNNDVKTVISSEIIDIKSKRSEILKKELQIIPSLELLKLIDLEDERQKCETELVELRLNEIVASKASEAKETLSEVLTELPNVLTELKIQIQSELIENPELSLQLTEIAKMEEYLATHELRIHVTETEANLTAKLNEIQVQELQILEQPEKVVEFQKLQQSLNDLNSKLMRSNLKLELLDRATSYSEDDLKRELTNINEYTKEPDLLELRHRLDEAEKMEEVIQKLNITKLNLEKGDLQQEETTLKEELHKIEAKESELIPNSGVRSELQVCEAKVKNLEEQIAETKTKELVLNTVMELSGGDLQKVLENLPEILQEKEIEIQENISKNKVLEDIEALEAKLLEVVKVEEAVTPKLIEELKSKDLPKLEAEELNLQNELKATRIHEEELVKLEDLEEFKRIEAEKLALESKLIENQVKKLIESSEVPEPLIKHKIQTIISTIKSGVQVQIQELEKPKKVQEIMELQSPKELREKVSELRLKEIPKEVTTQKEELEAKISEIQNKESGVATPQQVSQIKCLELQKNVLESKILETQIKELVLEKLLQTGEGMSEILEAIPTTLSNTKQFIASEIATLDESPGNQVNIHHLEERLSGVSKLEEFLMEEVVDISNLEQPGVSVEALIDTLHSEEASLKAQVKDIRQREEKIIGSSEKLDIVRGLVVEQLDLEEQLLDVQVKEAILTKANELKVELFKEEEQAAVEIQQAIAPDLEEEPKPKDLGTQEEGAKEELLPDTLEQLLGVSAPDKQENLTKLPQEEKSLEGESNIEPPVMTTELQEPIQVLKVSDLKTRQEVIKTSEIPIVQPDSAADIEEAKTLSEEVPKSKEVPQVPEPKNTMQTLKSQIKDLRSVSELLRLTEVLDNQEIFAAASINIEDLLDTGNKALQRSLQVDQGNLKTKIERIEVEELGLTSPQKLETVRKMELEAKGVKDALAETKIKQLVLQKMIAFDDDSEEFFRELLEGMPGMLRSKETSIQIELGEDVDPRYEAELEEKLAEIREMREFLVAKPYIEFKGIEPVKSLRSKEATLKSQIEEITWKEIEVLGSNYKVDEIRNLEKAKRGIESKIRDNELKEIVLDKILEFGKQLEEVQKLEAFLTTMPSLDIVEAPEELRVKEEELKLEIKELELRELELVTPTELAELKELEVEAGTLEAKLLETKLKEILVQTEAELPEISQQLYESELSITQQIAQSPDKVIEVKQLHEQLAEVLKLEEFIASKPVINKEDLIGVKEEVTEKLHSEERELKAKLEEVIEAELRITESPEKLEQIKVLEQDMKELENKVLENQVKELILEKLPEVKTPEEVKEVMKDELEKLKLKEKSLKEDLASVPVTSKALEEAKKSDQGLKLSPEKSISMTSKASKAVEEIGEEMRSSPKMIEVEEDSEPIPEVPKDEPESTPIHKGSEEDKKDYSESIPDVVKDGPETISITSKVTKSSPKVVEGDSEVAEVEGDSEVAKDGPESTPITSIASKAVENVVEEVKSSPEIAKVEDDSEPIPEIEVLDTQTKLSQIKILKQYVANVSRTAVSEMAANLAKHYTEKGFAHQLQRQCANLKSQEVLEPDQIQQLLKIEIQKLALAKVQELEVCEDANLEDLFEDALLCIPNILEEQESELRALVSEVNTEGLKLKYLKISNVEKEDLIEELSQGDVAKKLDAEEVKLKGRIEKIKADKGKLEESIQRSLEESTYTRKIDRDLDKLEVLERNQDELEEMLVKTQLKKLLVAQVEATKKSVEEVWEELPALLEQPYEVAQLLKPKVEPPVETNLQYLDEVRKLQVFLTSVSKDLLQHFAQELSNHCGERNYARRLDSEAAELRAQIMEIEAHKSQLDAISRGSEETLDQLAILEQEEVWLNERLMSNQVKQVALAKIESQHPLAEVEDWIVENALASVSTLLEEEAKRLKETKVQPVDAKTAPGVAETEEVVRPADASEDVEVPVGIKEVSKSEVEVVALAPVPTILEEQAKLLGEVEVSPVDANTTPSIPAEAEEEVAHPGEDTGVEGLQKVIEVKENKSKVQEAKLDGKQTLEQAEAAKVQSEVQETKTKSEKSKVVEEDDVEVVRLPVDFEEVSKVVKDSDRIATSVPEEPEVMPKKPVEETEETGEPTQLVSEVDQAFIPQTVEEISRVKDEAEKRVVTPGSLTESLRSSTESLQQDLDEVQKLKQHFTSITPEDKSEMVKDLVISYLELDFAKLLEEEETKIRAQLHEIRSLQAGQVGEVDLTEALPLVLPSYPTAEAEEIENQVTLLEARLMDNRLKKMALAKVSEQHHLSENLVETFEEIVYSIPEVLEEKERLLKATIEEVLLYSASEDDATITEPKIPVEAYESGAEDSLHSLSDLQGPVDPIVSEVGEPTKTVPEVLGFPIESDLNLSQASLLDSLSKDEAHPEVKETEVLLSPHVEKTRPLALGEPSVVQSLEDISELSDLSIGQAQTSDIEGLQITTKTSPQVLTLAKETKLDTQEVKDIAIEEVKKEVVSLKECKLEGEVLKSKPQVLSLGGEKLMTVESQEASEISKEEIGFETAESKELEELMVPVISSSQVFVAEESSSSEEEHTEKEEDLNEEQDEEENIGKERLRKETETAEKERIKKEEEEQLRKEEAKRKEKEDFENEKKKKEAEDAQKKNKEEQKQAVKMEEAEKIKKEKEEKIRKEQEAQEKENRRKVAEEEKIKMQEEVAKEEKQKAEKEAVERRKSLQVKEKLEKENEEAEREKAKQEKEEPGKISEEERIKKEEAVEEESKEQEGIPEVKDKAVKVDDAEITSKESAEAQELELKKEAEMIKKEKQRAAEEDRMRQEEELEKIKREKEEADREKVKKEKEEAEKEKLRKQKEEAEMARLKQEKEEAEKEKLKKEKEEAEIERLKRERGEAEREILKKEKEEVEKEKLKKVKEEAEKEKLQKEKEEAEKEKLKREREEVEKENLRKEKQEVEKEKLKTEKEEAEKEKQKKEKEEAEKEKQKKEKEEAEKEKSKREKEEADKEKLKKEKEEVEKEKLKKENIEAAEKEKLKKEKEEAEKEKLKKEKEEAEKEKLKKEKEEAGTEKLKREKEEAEKEKLKKEKEEAEKLKKEKEEAEKEKLTKEKEEAEKEKLKRKKDEAEKEKLNKEKEEVQKEKLKKEIEAAEKEKLKREKEEAEKEKLKKEKEEAEKEKLKKEKDEAEKEKLKKEKEKAEKLKKEKEEAEKEKLKKEKEEVEKEKLKKAQEFEEEKLKKGKEEAEKEKLKRKKEEAEKEKLKKEIEEVEKEKVKREKEEEEKLKKERDKTEKLNKEIEDIEKQKLKSEKEEAEKQKIKIEKEKTEQEEKQKQKKGKEEVEGENIEKEKEKLKMEEGDSVIQQKEVTQAAEKEMTKKEDQMIEHRERQTVEIIKVEKEKAAKAIEEEIIKKAQEEAAEKERLKKEKEEIDRKKKEEEAVKAAEKEKMKKMQEAEKLKQEKEAAEKEKNKMEKEKAEKIRKEEEAAKAEKEKIKKEKELSANYKLKKEKEAADRERIQKEEEKLKKKEMAKAEERERIRKEVLTTESDRLKLEEETRLQQEKRGRKETVEREELRKEAKARRKGSKEISPDESKRGRRLSKEKVKRETSPVKTSQRIPEKKERSPISKRDYKTPALEKPSSKLYYDTKAGYKSIITSYKDQTSLLREEKLHQRRTPAPARFERPEISRTPIPESMPLSRPRKTFPRPKIFETSSETLDYSIKENRTRHDRIQELIKYSHDTANTLSAMYTRFDRGVKTESRVSPLSKLSALIPKSSGISARDSLTRSRFAMDYRNYYDHYFKLPMAYSIYKSKLDRSYVYPRRYEVSLYHGLLSREESVTRGYSPYRSDIIKREITDSLRVNPIRVQYEHTRLPLVTEAKLVVGTTPSCEFRRHTKWESPESDKYETTSTFTKKTSSNFVFVKVKPKGYEEPLPDTTRSVARVSSYRLQRPPAVFLSRPDSLISVAPGEDIVISFEVNGGSRGKISWTKRSTDVTQNRRFRSEYVGSNRKYILKNACYDDMGTYCLTAENEFGSSRTFVTVTVDNNNYRNTSYYHLLRRHKLPVIGSARSLLPTNLRLHDFQRSTTPYQLTPAPGYRVQPPVFYTSPHNIVAESGESVRFQVTVGGFPSPTVTWLKDGRPIPANGARLRAIEKFNTKILEIAHLASEDTGNYTIEIHNDGGRAYASARLDMIALKRPQYRLKY